MTNLPLDTQIAGIRSEFPATTAVAYLNTGTIGPVPRCVLERHQALERHFHFGSPLDMAIEAHVESEFEDTRRRIADLVHSPLCDIALVQNTTDGINAALLSIGWTSGDQIITSDAEHSAVNAPLQYLQDRFGVQVTRLATVQGVLRPEHVAEAVGPRTRAVVISHASYMTGGVFPVQEICSLARARGLVTVIDGAQSVGAIPVNVPGRRCDFYAFSCYKWLVGPEGTAALYVSNATTYSPYRVSSRASERLPDGQYKLRQGARRFEGTGTMNALDFITLGASIAYVNELGRDQVYERVGLLCIAFKEGLQSIPGGRCITPMEPEQSAGLVAFRVDGSNPDELKERLHAQRLIIRTVANIGALRASFHFYNTLDEVSDLLSAIGMA